ncbi:MAG: type II toxin-antitoxin system VapC family toxin [Desulfuromonadaceae bacterium]|nr:type II toxin-antitoxin system VapC family toxin [Desulfuromonadaceae bacterium]
MKRILIDTHVLLWWLADDPRLGNEARNLIGAAANSVYVSAVTTWEITIKQGIGKVTAPDDLDTIVDQEGFEKLPISLYHGQQAGRLPLLHRDPFDRMLVAQAKAEGLTVMTADRQIACYDVHTLDASR